MQDNRSTETQVTIRFATAADNTQIAAIWNYEVQWSTATFDTMLRTPEQQAEWLAAHNDAYPAIIIAIGQEVAAYGALSPYRTKPAYRRTVENAVYVKLDHRGKGLSHLLLTHLIELAQARNYHTIMARITGGNAASMHLHERHGFGLVGVEREIGFKFGQWQDVVIMQRLLHTGKQLPPTD
jgi:phosphinothricin acetyltransferase